MNRSEKAWPSKASMLLCFGVAWLGIASPSVAATNQFRGVNWADSRDNFQAGVLYISGLSSSDTYDSAKATGTAIMDQFVSKLGANAVRMPINEATVSKFWTAYTGAIDAVLAKGKVVLCYWDSAKDNKPPDMNAWWDMWKVITDKYGSNENAYFEVFNEPNMYSKTDLGNLYNDWLTRFSTVPKGRVILDGTGNAQNVPDVGSDSRLKDCLLAVHDYSFFGSESMTKESDWENHIKGSVGSYSDRTICTEWGGPMSPGSKNGKSYDYLDYSKSPTNWFEGYIRGISNQLRAWNMGSFYWPGLRDGDWYSMMTKSGTGANITLSIPNKSGLERMQYAWGPGATGGSDGGVGGSSGGRDGGPGGSMADGAAGASGGRLDAAGVDGPGGRGGNGGASGSAGSASGGAAGSDSTVGGRGGSATGGTSPRSSSVTATSGGAGASSVSVGGSGGATTAAGGVSASSSPDSSGAGAKGSAGQIAAGASGSNQSAAKSSADSSGCSCALGRTSRDSSAAWAILLGFVMFAAVRRRS
jgi:MYXO-CTERM domain-containing protein